MRRAALLALFACALPAQEVLFPEGVTAVRLPLVMLSHGNFPGLPCVEVKIGERSALFLVDTGFNMTAVDERWAEELDLEERGSDIAIGMARSAKAPLYRAPEFRLGTAVLETRLSYGLDLRHFAMGRGRPIRGLLGGELFARCVVTLDYRGGEVLLTRPDAFVPPADAVEVELAFAIGQPEVWAQLDEQRRYRFMVDTGAEPHLLLNAPFVARHGLVDDADRLGSTRVGGIAGIRDVSLGAFDRLLLGDLAVANVPALLLRPTRRVSLGADQRRAGVLGTGLFARTRVTFDYPGRRMFVEPGDDGFAELRLSGLATRCEEDGQVFVSYLLQIPDRPELDLEADDRIVAIDGAPVRADGAELLRQLSANPATTLLIERNGERHEVEWPRLETLPKVRLAATK